MNFLAHLHIADASHSSLSGNLLGDFVKGNPEGHFPEEVVRGIFLHRFIDVSTDQHPAIDSIKSLFRGKSRRFAGIALDVFWDHCLSRHWEEFHREALHVFCQDAFCRIQSDITFAVPERFSFVFQQMQRGKWLESYQEMENIRLALDRMSHRSVRMQPLAGCYASLERHYDELLMCFMHFYPEILLSARRWMEERKVLSYRSGQD